MKPQCPVDRPDVLVLPGYVPVGVSQQRRRDQANNRDGEYVDRDGQAGIRDLRPATSPQRAPDCPRRSRRADTRATNRYNEVAASAKPSIRESSNLQLSKTSSSATGGAVCPMSGAYIDDGSNSNQHARHWWSASRHRDPASESLVRPNRPWIRRRSCKRPSVSTGDPTHDKFAPDIVGRRDVSMVAAIRPDGYIGFIAIRRAIDHACHKL